MKIKKLKEMKSFIVIDNNKDKDYIIWIIQSGFENMYLIVFEDCTYSISICYATEEEVKAIQKAIKNIKK